MKLHLGNQETLSLTTYLRQNLPSKQPIFACMYDLPLHRNNLPSLITLTNLTRHGKPQPLLTLPTLLWNGIYPGDDTSLSQSLTDLDKGKIHERFTMGIVQLNQTSSYLLVGVSVTSEACQGYPDEQLYAVDEIGQRVLKAGMEQGIKPDWAWANYPFNRIPLNEIQSSDFDLERLSILKV